MRYLLWGRPSYISISVGATHAFPQRLRLDLRPVELLAARAERGCAQTWRGEHPLGSDPSPADLVSGEELVTLDPTLGQDSKEEVKKRDAYMAQRATSPAPERTQTPPACPAWLKGNCPLGKKCRNAHDEAKKGTKP